MSKCTGGCGQSTSNCCCVKNYRGEKGPQGDRGPRGTQGPAGQDAEILITAVNDNSTQDITVPDGQIMVTNMIVPVAAGLYAVWFDASITGTGTGTYGVCVGGTFQDFDRLLPGAAGSISLCNGEVIVASAGNITIEAVMTGGTITVKRSSIIVQKIG